MKTLKFAPDLVPLVLEGSKTSTWRLFDDKNLTTGDLLNLVNRDTGKEFAKAEVTSVKETTFGQLTEKDKVGHEPFQTDKEIYKTYSSYYNALVNKHTPLKIISFVLLKQ